MVLCCFTRNNKDSSIIHNIYDNSSDDEYNEFDNNLGINDNYILNIEDNKINNIEKKIVNNSFNNEKLENFKLDLNKYYLENLEKKMFMIENGYWKKNSMPWNGYYSIKTDKFPKIVLKKYNEPPDFNNTFRLLFINDKKVKTFDGPIMKKNNKNSEYNIIYQIRNNTKNIRYSYVFPETNNNKIEDSLKIIIEIFKNLNNKIIEIEKKIDNIINEKTK